MSRRSCAKEKEREGKVKVKVCSVTMKKVCVQLAEGKRVVERRRELEREKEKKDKRGHFT